MIYFLIFYLSHLTSVKGGRMAFCVDASLEPGTAPHTRKRVSKLYHMVVHIMRETEGSFNKEIFERLGCIRMGLPTVAPGGKLCLPPVFVGRIN